LIVTMRIWEGYAKGYVPVIFEVQTVSTPRPYSKSRTWLRCPECGRRRVVLAVNHQEHKLACRVCTGLSYETQSMTRRARIERRIELLPDRLERGRRR
jgi:transcription elongation factor Elf1